MTTTMDVMTVATRRRVVTWMSGSWMTELGGTRGNRRKLAWGHDLGKGEVGRNPSACERASAGELVLVSGDLV